MVYLLEAVIFIKILFIIIDVFSPRRQKRKESAGIVV